MTQSFDPQGVLAERVKTLRKRNGWSAQRLGEELTRYGVKWDRSIVANFESGRRASVSVVEWLALAYVLDVAPIHLLVPIDAEGGELYRVVPEELDRPVYRVRDWIRGQMPVGKQDKRRYYSEVPANEHEVPASQIDTARSGEVGPDGRRRPRDVKAVAEEQAAARERQRAESDEAWAAPEDGEPSVS
jgi:transcriptional regulator with XRE-family HTH domain